MKKTPSNPSEAAELRRRAKAWFSEKQKSERLEAGTKRTADDTQRLVQELQIHQIELEMRNEQLEQARAETQKVLELYTDLYDFAPSGYFTLDRDGTIRQANLTGSALLGVDRSQLVNRRFGLFVAENSRLAFRAFAEKVFASQLRETCEAMLLREGNSPFYACIGARSSENGRECRTVVVDITERKEAEEEIRRLAAKLEQQNSELTARNQELLRSEQKLLLQSTALETAANAMVITDTEGIILWVNSAFVALTGYTSKEAIGKTPRLLKSGQHDLKFYKALWKTLLAGRTWRGSFINRRKDGSFYHDEHTITPVRSKDGAITHFIAILNDITARKRAEEEISQLNVGLEHRVIERTTQLEAALKEIEAFSYSVSHDLRAPIRAMDGYSRMMLEQYGEKVDPEGRRTLKVIRSEAKRMGVLIDDLLAFSRLSRQPMVSSDVDMTALARSVFESLATFEGDRELRLVLRPLPVMQGELAMLRQVWTNLLSNAIKFTRYCDVAEIEIGTENGAGEQIYCVKDNGAGFDMRYAGKLFGVFQRLHTEQEFPGTGVGLAIVERVITRHGGRVWAEGKINEGATIYFAIPKTNG